MLAAAGLALQIAACQVSSQDQPQAQQLVSQTFELGNSYGTTVHAFKLPDGTRCILAVRGGGGTALSCDWRAQ